MATPEEKSIGDQYLEKMAEINSAPISQEDIFSESERLSFMMPQQRKSNFYDLASDLGRGLAEQAASGQPASIGYGLAKGFNYFSEGISLRNQQRDKYKQQLQMMGYQSLEKRRSEQMALRKEAADLDFKVLIEKIKNGEQGLFSGLNTPEGRALDFITRAEVDPTLKIRNKAEYENAIKILSAPQYKQILTEAGIVFTPLPGKYAPIVSDVKPGEQQALNVGDEVVGDSGIVYIYQGGPATDKNSWKEK